MATMTGRVAVVGPLVAADGDIRGGLAVLTTGGLIDAVVGTGEVPVAYEIDDVGPGILAPGFIDIHTHGAAGRSFNEADPQAYRQALAAQLAAGVTTVLPTIASAPLNAMRAAVTTFEGFMHSRRIGDCLPRTPGLHLEGPYFSEAQRGAQNRAALRRPDDGSINRLLEFADAIRMVSFAPEIPGAVTLTGRLVEAGIVAAAGHSDGRDTDLYACQRAGLSHVIHIVSGQSTTIRLGPWRKPGILEATLASDGLTVEMIADGKHLPATLMRLAYRCLAGRLCLVSDATPGAGLPRGSRYTLGTDEYVVDDGVGMTIDRTAFAGSTTLVPAMLPIAAETLGAPAADLIAMVTSIPARAAHLPDVGRIAPGCHADFVLLDAGLVVKDAAVGGVWRHRQAVPPTSASPGAPAAAASHVYE